MITSRERIIKVFNKEEVDRPPCICPGGMMNMITIDLMEKANIFWPNAHLNAEKMAQVAISNYENNCFENYGVPFCMTIEAEALGSTVTMGTREFEPHVTEYAIDSVTDYKKLNSINLHEGRAKVVLDAIKILKEKNDNVPIIGNITGPISTASSLMEPVNFYKELRKKNKEAHEFMQFVTDEIIKFARAQIDAGADIIAISDPSGSGEILGPRDFEQFAVKYINQVIDSLQDEKIGTIVHICGQMRSVYKQIDMINSNVLSFDSVVSMKNARMSLANRVLMGNVSTYALEFGTPKKISSLIHKCIEDGSDIISPACGLGTKSPLKNIQTILHTLKQEEIEVNA